MTLGGLASDGGDVAGREAFYVAQEQGFPGGLVELLDHGKDFAGLGVLDDALVVVEREVYALLFKRVQRGLLLFAVPVYDEITGDGIEQSAVAAGGLAVPQGTARTA